jgi:SnoaL-like domain
MSNLSNDPIIYAETLALVTKMYSALDAGDADGVFDCFADDGVWQRAEGAKKGEAAIRAVVTDRPSDQVTAHCVSNLRVRGEPGSRVAEYYLTVFGTSSEMAPRLVTLLECTDQLCSPANAGLRIRVKRTKVRMKFSG